MRGGSVIHAYAWENTGSKQLHQTTHMRGGVSHPRICVESSLKSRPRVSPSPFQT
ncbi:hypothetical protein PIB30_103821, partial [Stylosanthes scabra]|nr:hypothetical protein [Stylosanthes scabra]